MSTAKSETIAKAKAAEARIVTNENKAPRLDFIAQFKAARRVSVPLMTVKTPDPAATMSEVARNMPNETPLIQWDIVRGWVGLNRMGQEVVKKAVQDNGADSAALMTGNPVECLEKAVQLPANTILFYLNAQDYVGNAQQGGGEAVRQALWNLRDLYKANRRMLVLLCPQIELTGWLANDILVLDEPLPDMAALKVIVEKQYNSAGIEKPSDQTIDKAVDATCGLAAFPVEQVVAMSFVKRDDKVELDLDALWERKRQMIEATPGLSVWRGPESFDTIGGVENFKRFARAILGGRTPPRCIGFIDEIEKAIGGAGGAGFDTSGVSQSLMGAYLSYMQDTSATGIIAIGPPGCAKSLMAKAIGNTAGVPTIQFDLGGMKASLVGESEARMRTALKVVDAVSQGSTLWIATCNSIGSLPPELRRRFTFGTFFFDLPDTDERKVIWKLYMDKYELPTQDVPGDVDWTGAEIKQACELAWRLNITLTEAAGFIVPVAVSARDTIEKLRSQANGRFISASYPGPYKHITTDPVLMEQAQQTTGDRKFSLEDWAK